MIGLNYSEIKAVETCIETRLAEHELEHKGLYSESDLNTLRPIWRAQILKDIDEIVNMMPIEV